MLDFKTVEEIPKPRRGHRASEERAAIQAELVKSVDSDYKLGTVIEGVEAGETYNKLQQRIRSAGTAIGVRVTVVYEKVDETTGNVYFQAKPAKEKTKTAKKS